MNLTNHKVLQALEKLLRTWDKGGQEGHRQGPAYETPVASNDRLATACRHHVCALGLAAGHDPPSVHTTCNMHHASNNMRTKLSIAWQHRQRYKNKNKNKMLVKHENDTQQARLQAIAATSPKG